MSESLVLFIIFIAITLGITYWAASRTRTKAQFYTAGGGITAFQNGWAVAGDYMSAASFLGIAGLIAFNGYDGFMYSVGWLVAYLTVLLVVAEPLRNAGRYTMADVLAYRLKPRPVRAMASVSTLTVSTFYMIAQMVGAGALVALLLKDSGISYRTAVIGVGILMIVYVVFGGMLATTWVQIIKAILLMAGTVLLSILVLAHFGFSFGAFFNAIAHVTYHEKGVEVVKDFLQPGLRFKPPYGALDLISLGLALIFGTAGLPHILVRFYTVPDAKTARTSVVWAMALIGSFYIMTTFLGFGAATIVGRDYISTHGGTNMSAPLLGQALAGNIFFAFISSIAFATILAVVAGLTISASTSFAHDFWTNVIHRGVERKPGEEVLVARISAFVVGAIAIAIAILLGPTFNVAFLVGLAFAVAASANLPVIVLSIFWKRFNTAGAVTGLAVGLLASIGLILISPSIMAIDPPTVTGAARHLIQAKAIFPLENPGILSIPLGFVGAILGTLLSHEPSSEHKFNELLVRSNTGLGAEKAAAH
ncbi:MAG: cation/acetate symporter ActP [Acidobacteriaceae bacterium]|nr:cation/acetate symporter ActP [Acidobacteriaceae bacterium]